MNTTHGIVWRNWWKLWPRRERSIDWWWSHGVELDTFRFSIYSRRSYRVIKRIGR